MPSEQGLCGIRTIVWRPLVAFGTQRSGVRISPTRPRFPPVSRLRFRPCRGPVFFIPRPRIGELIGVPEVRRMGVEGFPCGWLYLERPEILDVVRLLADRQDTARLLETDPE